MSLATREQSSFLGSMPRRSTYRAPSSTVAATLKQLMAEAGRKMLDEKQSDLLRHTSSAGGRDDVRVFYAGDISLLKLRCVSIVGTREVSDDGWTRASRLAKELANAGIVIVSGLARGVDTAAMTSAIENGGRTIGVIGTPLSKAYPAENASLQETVWRRDLLLSPFADREPVFKSNFPKRNRLMATISDATVIVEASDTSGTLHQAAECQKLGRWLFIVKSVAEDPNLKWPRSFLTATNAKAAMLEKTEDILKVIE
jgi:DNA processing protein